MRRRSSSVHEPVESQYEIIYMHVIVQCIHYSITVKFLIWRFSDFAENLRSANI